MRSRRIRALLASGLVLSVGTMVTLAAWTGEEYATGTLEAGTFEIEGSTDGGSSWDDNFGSLEDPHQLRFDVVADAMYPGSTTYAGFSVRTKDGSLGGWLQINAATNEADMGGLGQFLTYGVSQIPAGEACDETSYTDGTQVIASGGDLDEGISGDLELPSGSAGDRNLNFCLALTLPEGVHNDAQGQEAYPTWEFHAHSASD